MGGERESDGEVCFWTMVLAEVECVLNILPEFFSEPESESLSRSSRICVEFPVRLGANVFSDLNEVQVCEFILNRAQCGFHEVQTIFCLQSLVSGNIRPNQCWIRIVVECRDPAVLSVAVVMMLLACVAQCGVAVPHQCDELTRCRVILRDHSFEIGEHYVD